MKLQFPDFVLKSAPFLGIYTRVLEIPNFECFADFETENAKFPRSIPAQQELLPRIGPSLL